jgi:hypothetical protein
MSYRVAIEMKDGSWVTTTSETDEKEDVAAAAAEMVNSFGMSTYAIRQILVEEERV